MTNFNHIQAMNVEELAEWLDENGQFDTAPWTFWFNNKYCANCESIKIEYKEAKEKLGLNVFFYGPTTECAYCECNDHCRFFPNIEGIPGNKEVIEMWLKEEAKNDR